MPQRRGAGHAVGAVASRAMPASPHSTASPGDDWPAELANAPVQWLVRQ